ncbi:MAG: hypothetical protein MZV64_10010 [Ignavibacteriales bacterium]|nr:hypothetical protein [Ignavibacteriales bacterium]
MPRLHDALDGRPDAGRGHRRSIRPSACGRAGASPCAVHAPRFRYPGERRFPSAPCRPARA